MRHRLGLKPISDLAFVSRFVKPINLQTWHLEILSPARDHYTPAPQQSHYNSARFLPCRPRHGYGSQTAAASLRFLLRLHICQDDVDDWAITLRAHVEAASLEDFE